MRVLSRYVLREFFKLFILCLVAFVLIYLLVDFIDQINKFFKYDATASMIARYYAYKLPLIVFQMIPLSVLISTLVSLSILSRNSEVTAMKAGGVSLYRVTSPILVFSLVISGVSFAVNEFVVPESNAHSEYIWRVEIKGKEPEAEFRTSRIWHRSAKAPGWPESIYYITKLKPEQGSMQGIAIFRFDEQFKLVRRGWAETADYRADRPEGRRWIFHNGVYRHFWNDEVIMQAVFNDYPFEMVETADDLKIERKSPDQMGFNELKDYIDRTRDSGDDPTKYEVDLHGKIAFPLVSVIMALLGIPFALKTGRTGGVALGIGIALVIAVTYWIIMAMCVSLGHSEVLPPIAAAWASHMLFGLIGATMLINVKQ